MITRLHHAQVTLPPGAEEEARRFYCGFLGLTEIEKPEALQSRGGLWLQVGDRQVHLGLEDGVDRAASKAHLAYQVDDLAAWRERLRQAGIQPQENAAIPGYDRVELRDPFGNRLELIQRTGPTADLLDRIREIEEAAANAWPAGVQQAVDGWRLRYHLGVTRRANSVLCPADDGRLSLEAKLEAAEAFYRRRNLPPRFQLTVASLPLALDAFLEERGYTIPDRTVVMTAGVDDLHPAPEVENGPVTGFREAFFPEWLDAYALAEKLTRERLQARRSILERIGPRTAYFWSDFGANAPESGHIPPCVAIAVVEGPLLGMFSMATRPDLRRRGLASAIFRAAAAWGREQGAERIYLQVAEENTGAITAYEKLGFQPLYHYWYRELTDSVDAEG